MHLKDRIKIASERQVGSNCIDTALFWIGVTPDESDTELPKPDFLEKYGMQKIDKPELGCVVTFAYETYSGIGLRIAHIGVVIEANPGFQIAHRKGSNPEVKFEDLGEFLKNNYVGYVVEYHRPQPLSAK